MTILKWGLSIVVGLFLLAFGAMKFTGGAHIFQYIEYNAAALGVPASGLFFPLVNWATGALEIIAGLLVLAPMTRRLGTAVALLPFAGAFVFHISPLLGINVPTGFSDPAPAEALAAGGPFARGDFAEATTPMLFVMASVMLLVAIANFVIHRRAD